MMEIELNEICSKIADIDHKMPKAVDSGVPFLSAKDVSAFGTLNFDKIKYISDEDFLRLSRKICPTIGDIIYTRIGTIGRCAVVREDKRFLVSYSCCVIRPKTSDVDTNYLSYYLSSEYALSQATHGVKGIGVPDLGMKQIKGFKIPLPPLPNVINLSI